jgi:putative membrane protein
VRSPVAPGDIHPLIAGVAVLWVGADWPIHQVAESYLYSVHMFQHLLFQLVAAPLLILGTPSWLLRRLLRPPLVQAVWRALTKPLVALVIVLAFTAGVHVPAVVDTSAANPWFHLAVHVALVGVSLVMWWPVLSPLQELPHLSYPGRMAYLFAHSIVPTVPASFLTFAYSPLYEAYATYEDLMDLTEELIVGLAKEDMLVEIDCLAYVGPLAVEHAGIVVA